MNIVEAVEKDYLKADVPRLRSGDTVRVHVKVVEGTRERIQVFEGVVIAITKSGLEGELHRPPRDPRRRR